MSASPATAPLSLPSPRAKRLPGKPAAKLVIIAPARESNAARDFALTLTYARLRVTASGAELLTIDILLASLSVKA